MTSLKPRRCSSVAGVQFGPLGDLSSNCSLEYCSWLDADSRAGFLDMAQCVISQYSEQCCPLSTGNVHCANGDTTQGENIADIGGQLAAYNAYRAWAEQQGAEEAPLPGLESYTANQVSRNRQHNAQFIEFGQFFQISDVDWKLLSIILK